MFSIGELMANNEISKKIRELRKALKLTQSQFAELAHLSEDSIGKIERGTGGVPTVETLMKISDALKMPIEDLIYPAKKKTAHKPSKELADLTAYLRTRPPYDIKLIHELAVKIREKKQVSQRHHRFHRGQIRAHPCLDDTQTAP